MLSEYLRVVRMQSKSVPDEAEAFERMFEGVQARKSWYDKATELSGAFQSSGDKKKARTHTQQLVKQNLQLFCKTSGFLENITHNHL